MDALRRVAYAYGRWNRGRKLQHALEFARRVEARSVLLVGVHTGGDGLSNNVERGLAAAIEHVVGVGLAPDGPTWLEYHQGDARDLAFGDGQFDLVFSNAVIEHVGDEADQQRFVDEHPAWAATGCSPRRTAPSPSRPTSARCSSTGTHAGSPGSTTSRAS